MSAAAIEISEVSKHFGAFEAVKRLSLSIAPGSCYGLIGPNGAGKTTTFSMMCGFLHPSTGAIRIRGIDPSTPGALKGVVGVLPQDAVLPPQSRVGELLTYWAKLSGVSAPEQSAKDALARVGLLETWRSGAGTLSHGMAKRVAMAQALIGDPPVVLLDEPTAGLDPKIAAQVRELIRSMKGRQTVVVSSHNLQELEELCDAAAILDKGTLVQSGSMSELTSSGAAFRVRIAGGNVPLAELRALEGIREVQLEPTGALAVQFDPTRKPEEVITRTLELLIRSGALIGGVTRGHRLEDRVLQIT